MAVENFFVGYVWVDDRVENELKPRIPPSLGHGIFLIPDGNERPASEMSRMP